MYASVRRTVYACVYCPVFAAYTVIHTVNLCFRVYVISWISYSLYYYRYNLPVLLEGNTLHRRAYADITHTFKLLIFKVRIRPRLVI